MGRDRCVSSRLPPAIRGAECSAMEAVCRWSGSSAALQRSGVEQLELAESGPPAAAVCEFASAGTVPRLAHVAEAQSRSLTPQPKCGVGSRRSDFWLAVSNGGRGLGEWGQASRLSAGVSDGATRASAPGQRARAARAAGSPFQCWLTSKVSRLNTSRLSRKPNTMVTRRQSCSRKRLCRWYPGAGFSLAQTQRSNRVYWKKRRAGNRLCMCFHRGAAVLAPPAGRSKPSLR
jgi:hypothetical protein